MIPFDHEHQFMQRANELFVRISGCMRQRCYHRECCCFIGDCLTLIRSHSDICVDLFGMGLKSDGLRPFATPSNPSTRKPVFAANTAFVCDTPRVTRDRNRSRSRSRISRCSALSHHHDDVLHGWIQLILDYGTNP